MITPTLMIQILKNRRLQLIPVLDPRSNIINWLTRTIDGTRAGSRLEPYPTPEEAVEAAEAWLSAAEVRDNEHKSAKVISALEKGKYFVRSREISATDEEGKPIKKTVFSVYHPNGNATEIVDRLTFADAVLSMEEVLK